MTVYSPSFLKFASNKHLNYLTIQHYIEAEVVFGVFSNNCAGNGICRITPKNATKNNSCRCCSSTLRIYNYANHLLLYFPASSISQAVREKYFSNNFFLQEEDLEVPITIINKLGMESYTVHQGHYQLWQLQNDVFLLL